MREKIQTSYKTSLVAPAPSLGGGRVCGQAHMLLLQAAKILQTNQMKNLTENNHNLQVKKNEIDKDTKY